MYMFNKGDKVEIRARPTDKYALTAVVIGAIAYINNIRIYEVETDGKLTFQVLRVPETNMTLVRVPQEQEVISWADLRHIWRPNVNTIK